ncbi:hypothetical protein F5Y16DRAFT_396077 [Xylariaceae sp. FL0255]|nr:hypothetical protein F5Y16DRAFT_396077 [Xylariaceae sp. FL0255]
MSTDDDLWNIIEKHALTPNADATLKAKLRKAMPPTQPFTFSHGDLSLCNIMVDKNEDGKYHLSGLIDSECSGYYPAWWEYARNFVLFTPDDQAWKELLLKYMKSDCETNEAGLRWWRAIRAIARFHGTEGEAERLRELFGDK